MDDVSHVEYFENLATGETAWALPAGDDAVVWDACLADDGVTWFYVPRSASTAGEWDFHFSEGFADWTSVSSTSASVSNMDHASVKRLQDTNVTHRLRDDGDGNLWLQSAYTVISKSTSAQKHTTPSAGGAAAAAATTAAAVRSQKRLTGPRASSSASAHSSNESSKPNNFQVVAYDVRKRGGRSAANTVEVEVGHTQWDCPNVGWMLTQEVAGQDVYYTHVESGVCLWSKSPAFVLLFLFFWISLSFLLLSLTAPARRTA